MSRNLQFLVFGQMIPVGGFVEDAAGDVPGRGTTFKTLKTLDLEQWRIGEIKALDDSELYNNSKDMLEQYHHVKRILLNFSFVDKGKRILATDLNGTVLDEMRTQRKILMVLNDAQVDEYINLDMTEIDIYDETQWVDLDFKTK